MRVLSLVLCLAAVACSSSSHSHCGGDVEQPKAELQVVSYNDVYEIEQKENRGGPSRVIPLVKRMRRNFANTLVIFAGDTMSPSLWSSEFKGMHMVTAHNQLTVDMACLGNHEFDYGLEAFFNVSKASKFPWLNANCYETATKKLLRHTVPHMVKKFSDPVMGEITVGAFGVMYDMKDPSKGLYWSDPIEAAKEQVRILREEKKVDFVIALTHQFWQDDNRLSSQVSGLDMIFGGHDHTAMMQTTFGAPYLKSDFDFRTIWHSKIKYYVRTDSKGKNVTESIMTHKNIPITEELATDKKMEEIIKGFRDEIGKVFNQKAGTICRPFSLERKLVRTVDVDAGKVYADSQLNAYGGKANAAIMNGGGLRTDKIWPAGDLTIGDIISWSPFGNTLFIAKMTGAVFKKYLVKQMGTSCGGERTINQNGHYFHPAGFTYVFKCTSEGVGDIESIKWSNGSDMTDGDEVKLALSNYMYTSRFKPDFGEATLIIDDKSAVRIDTILQDYFKANPEICPKVDDKRSLVKF